MSIVVRWNRDTNIITWVESPTDSFLVEYNGSFYTYNNGWQVLTIAGTEPEKSDYQSYGMIDLKEPLENLYLLGTTAKILRFTETEILNPTLNIIGEIMPQVIKATGDIVFENIKSIDSLNVTANLGTGDIKIVTSYDKGVTWEGSGRQLVNIESIEDFQTKGMTVQEFNQNDFNHLQEDKTIRNAYLLVGSAELDELTSTTTIFGELEKQLDDLNLKVNLTNTEMTITYLKDGDYVINIVE